MAFRGRKRTKPTGTCSRSRSARWAREEKSFDPQITQINTDLKAKNRVEFRSVLGLQICVYLRNLRIKTLLFTRPPSRTRPRARAGRLCAFPSTKRHLSRRTIGPSTRRLRTH